VHPPSCLKGLIAGEIRRYWIQNSPAEFQNILTKFIEWLLNRGHTLEGLTPIIQQAVSLLDYNNNQVTNKPQTNDNTLYIHRVYHPNGLQRSDIRQLYDNILKPHLNFGKMTVAISRPTNLLTSSKLKPSPDININKLIANLTQKQHRNKETSWTGQPNNQNETPINGAQQKQSYNHSLP